MTNMENDNVKMLTMCISELDTEKANLQEYIQREGYTTQTPAIMLLSAFEFGRNTIRSMIVVSELGDACSVTMPTICRSFYELAIKLSWASHAENGWIRLHCSMAREYENWANRIVGLELWRTVAERILSDLQGSLNLRDANGNPYKNLPNMETMLDQNAKNDLKTGVREQLGNSLVVEYSHIWQAMNRTAHAHISEIRTPRKIHGFLSAMGAVFATYALIRAAAAYVANGNIAMLKGMIDDIVPRILSTMNLNENDGEQAT